MSQHDRELERRARELFLRASHDVDPAMSGRLRAARRTALSRPHASAARRLLLPAGAFAVLALASLIVWQPGGSPPSPASIGAAVESDPNDLPPDADSADPALYKDLQFYSWLAYNDTKSPSRK
ncbi:hypothetical protein SAMN02800692_2553 [Luteibacter sp. UNC138MFCol5.1]|uniref:hypothetical protein n=1 Tax=Luteibacter sp. UNC138MFCol5.1 TaxID=1502774 RepID=UPI0008C39584|nr:hypothetical protein [Luteibacter sp. UNC138MFCol5.1]SEO85574.1 hypothetical protein SAMN02800692_2553 [Luteibacter sp. UNC138MFCol5.1]